MASRSVSSFVSGAWAYGFIPRHPTLLSSTQLQTDCGTFRSDVEAIAFNLPPI